MNFRQTAILIGSVLVVGVVLLILTSTSDDGKTDGAGLTEELVGFKADQIDTVELERETGSRLKLVRTDATKKTWELAEPYRAPADGAAIEAVIRALLRAKPTAHPNTGTNPALRGLDPPGLKVTIRGEGKSSTINLGDIEPGAKGVIFVTTSARPARPMAVPRSELDALLRDGRGEKAVDLVRWIGDYRVKSVFPSDSRAAGEDVASVRVEMPNKKKDVALTRAPNGAWRFDSPAGWGDADVEGDAAGSPGTFTGVRRMLGALTSVAAASGADFIDQPKDLKEYGLDDANPDLVKVKLTTRDGQSATVYFGKTEGAPPMPKMPPGMQMPPAPGSKVYVRVEGQPGVIRATSGDLSGLTGVVLDPAPLRDRTLITADRAKADGLDVALPDQPVTKLRRTGQFPQWNLYGGTKDPQLAFAASVEKVLDVVFARRTIKDFPAPNPANFATVSATVFVYVDGFNPPAGEKAEPVKKAEPIKIEFGRRDGETLYVRRTLPGLPPNEFTVPAQMKVGVAGALADVAATAGVSRLDLLDPTLPTFGSEAVASVTASGAVNFTLARDEKPDPSTREVLWRFTAPDPKGRIADAQTLSEMLRLLGTTQSVTRFVDEFPSDAKLAEYGFAPAPRLKVVVGMVPGSPDKERVYEFGKDTPDPNYVYARVAGRTAVFTLPRLVYDRWAAPDLRDRMVFRGVDGTKVNKIELKGWADAGFPTELVFEKNKDGAWAATKAPAGFVLDPVKVNAFADLVSGVRAKTFEKGMPTGVHGFGDPKHAPLLVTMHWPGGTMAFNMGATPDAGATYYGWSPWLSPDPVFTFEGALFKPFKEKPAGFAK